MPVKSVMYYIECFHWQIRNGGGVFLHGVTYHCVGFQCPTLVQVFYRSDTNILGAREISLSLAAHIWGPEFRLAAFT